MLIDAKAPRSRARTPQGAASSRRSYLPYSRFMQPDPIGYDDGMNMYAYVGNDPVNFTDPLGLSRDDTPIPGTQYLIDRRGARS